MSTFLYSILYFKINLKIIKLIRCKISIKISFYKLFRYTCYSFNESITTVYTHRVIGWRICAQCYFTLPNSYQLYYNVGNEGHYMIVPETANMTCGLCNKILLKSNKPAIECLDCIEEYLNHPLTTNFSLEKEVRNNLFDSL